MAKTVPVAAIARRPARNWQALKWTQEQHYVIKIERWNWTYSFGINNTPNIFPEVYNDYRHLELSGQLLRPTYANIDVVELVFILTERYDKIENNAASRADLTPRAIGQINVNKRLARGVFSMPSSALPLVLTALSADRIAFVRLNGQRLFRRQAEIARFSFEREYDAEDLPSEEPSSKRVVRKRTGL